MRNKRKTSNHEQLDLFGATDKAKREFGAKAGVEELALPEVDEVEFNLGGSEANTMIRYQYRDGDNYKQFKDVILNGRLSRADIRKMFDVVFDYKLFLASQVGLEDLQLRFDNGWEIEADHPWHEISEISYVGDAPTADDYQNVTTVTEFIAKWPLTVDGWDNVGAEERLIEAMGLSKGSKKLMHTD